MWRSGHACTPQQAVRTLRPRSKQLQQVQGVVLQAMLPGEKGSLQPSLVKQQHRSASAGRDQCLAPARLQRQPERWTAESESLPFVQNMCSARLACSASSDWASMHVCESGSPAAPHPSAVAGSCPHEQASLSARLRGPRRIEDASRQPAHHSKHLCQHTWDAHSTPYGPQAGSTASPHGSASERPTPKSAVHKQAAWPSQQASMLALRWTGVWAPTEYHLRGLHQLGELFPLPEGVRQVDFCRPTQGAQAAAYQLLPSCTHQGTGPVPPAQACPPTGARLQVGVAGGHHCQGLWAGVLLTRQHAAALHVMCTLLSLGTGPQSPCLAQGKSGTGFAAQAGIMCTEAERPWQAAIGPCSARLLGVHQQGCNVQH